MGSKIKYRNGYYRIMRIIFFTKATTENNIKSSYLKKTLSDTRL